MPEQVQLGPVLEFMRVLWAIDHEMQSVSKRMLRTHGVTGPQRLVIRIVGQAPHISAGEVADILHLHPSTLTAVLRRLDERGLIVRAPDPKDGRRVRLTLTPAGHELNGRHDGTMEAIVKDALGAMPTHDVDAARAALETIVVRARQRAN